MAPRGKTRMASASAACSGMKAAACAAASCLACSGRRRRRLEHMLALALSERAGADRRAEAAVRRLKTAALTAQTGFADTLRRPAAAGRRRRRARTSSSACRPGSKIDEARTRRHERTVLPAARGLLRQPHRRAEGTARCRPAAIVAGNLGKRQGGPGKGLVPATADDGSERLISGGGSGFRQSPHPRLSCPRE
jgi:hypothetical protein